MLLLMKEKQKMSKNYIVPVNRWIPLSDLMNQDYDHTKDYIIHVNDIVSGLLQYTKRKDTPTNKDVGQQYTKFSTINVGANVGDDVYLRATATPINIEVYTKVSTLNDLF